MRNPDHTPLCQCGSCEEAFDAALKTMEQLLTHQCPAWFFAVTMAQWRVAEQLLALNPEGQPFADRFEGHLYDQHEPYGKRLDDMLKRAGFTVLYAEDLPPDGSTIQ